MSSQIIPVGGTNLNLTATEGFAAWLSEQGGFVAFTTPVTEMLWCLSSDSRGVLHVSYTPFGFVRGLAVDHRRMWLGGDTRLWCLANVGARTFKDAEYDAVYVLRDISIVGHCRVHDVAQNVIHNGTVYDVIFANTQFSTLATLDPVQSFQPLWTPRFISKLAPEDRCHLNSFAVRDGQMTHAAVFSETDHAKGWQSAGGSPGGIIDVASGEWVCANLAAPHTPRWHQDRLWVANSGWGEFGFVDFATGKFEMVATVPGFVRGAAVIGDYAIVGASSRRPSPFLQAEAKQGAPAEAGRETSGLFVIDLRRGTAIHALTLQGCPGIYDVVHVAGITRPLIVNAPEAPEDVEAWTTFPV